MQRSGEQESGARDNESLEWLTCVNDSSTSSKTRGQAQRVRDEGLVIETEQAQKDRILSRESGLV